MSAFAVEQGQDASRSRFHVAMFCCQPGRGLVASGISLKLFTLIFA
jgi:hypothetical protein